MINAKKKNKGVVGGDRLGVKLRVFGGGGNETSLILSATLPDPDGASRIE